MRDPMIDIFGDKLPNISLFRIPIGAPEWIFNTDWKTPRFIDIYFLGAIGGFYPMRMWMHKIINDNRGPIALPRSDIHFYHGEAPAFTGRSDPYWTIEEQEDHQQWYAECLRHTKIFPMCGGILGYPVGKFFEAMACGCLVLSPMPRDGNILGFRDEVNMVVVNADNFREKLYQYLDDNKERERIARNGWELANKYHTHKAQALNMAARLKRIVFDKEPADKVEAENDAMMAAL
jgi:glycosyltransferase involved in cell wall biosynthesis